MRIPKFIGRMLGWYSNLDAIQKVGVALGIPSVSGLAVTALTFATQSSDTIIGIVMVIWTAAVAAALLMFFRRYIWKPQPLDVSVSVGNVTWSPTSAGQGTREWIIRINDLLLSNREAKRLDLRSLLWVKARHGGHRSLSASIPCRSGIATVQTEVGPPPHLPTEIPLLPDGAPQRGHIDFVGLYADDDWAGQAMEGVELELIDIRSGRSLRIAL